VGGGVEEVDEVCVAGLDFLPTGGLFKLVIG
jgi:hypothetical protein